MPRVSGGWRRVEIGAVLASWTAVDKRVRKYCVTDSGSRHIFFSMQHLETNSLLDAKSLARYLRVSTRTLENMLLRGEGPPYLRLGRQRRWRSADVEAWLLDRAECRQPQVKMTLACSDSKEG